MGQPVRDAEKTLNLAMALCGVWWPEAPPEKFELSFSQETGISFCMCKWPGTTPEAEKHDQRWTGQGRPAGGSCVPLPAHPILLDLLSSCRVSAGLVALRSIQEDNEMARRRWV